MSELTYDVDPMSDIFVQYLFALKSHEGMLQSFVNSVLKDADRPITVSLEVRNPINLERFLKDKRTIVDLRAKDDSGRTVQIEVQTYTQPSFVDRTLDYACRTYSEQLTEGNSYELLRPTISIALVCFPLFSKKLSKLHNVFHLRSSDAPDYVLTDHLELHYLELTEEKLERFPEDSAELRHWLDFFFFANQKTEEEMQTLIDLNNPVAQAYEKYKEFCADPDLRAAAQTEEKARRDYFSRLTEWKELGRVEGEARGKVLGLAEGEARGKVLGRAEGEARGKVLGHANAVLRLLQRKFPKARGFADAETLIHQITSADVLDELLYVAMDAETMRDFLVKLRKY